MWEAFEQAGYGRLHNLTAIIDVNRLGQRGPTRQVGTPPPTRGASRPSAGTPSRSTATTWTRSTPPTPRPRTVTSPPRSSPGPARARGFAEVEERRGRPRQAGAGRGGGGGRTRRSRHLRCRWPARGHRRHPDRASLSLPRFTPGDGKVATRTAFGQALAVLGEARGDLVASTPRSRLHPHLYFEQSPSRPVLRVLHRRTADDWPRPWGCQVRGGCRSRPRSRRS